MPKQVMAYGNGGGISSLASVPMETTLAGQPHRLVYVNPQEEQMMLAAGGAGLPGPGGIPAYWKLFEPSTWGDGNGFEGFTSSSSSSSTPSNNSDDSDSTPTFNSLSEASKAGYHGQAVNIAGKGLQKVEFADDSYNTQMSNASAAASNTAASSDNDRPGFIDSILMGIGYKEKTAGYDAATAAGIAARQAQEEQARLNPTAGDDDNVVAVAPPPPPPPPQVIADTFDFGVDNASNLGQFNQNQLDNVVQVNPFYDSNEIISAGVQDVGISSGVPAINEVQNPGLQNYNALVPAVGTSNMGLASLPLTPATNTPYTFMSYAPQTYNPVVGGGLMLPPLA